MEIIFIKDWYINYYWEWEEIEVSFEQKRILELWWFYKDWEVFEKEKTIEEIKIEKIQKFKEIKKEAVQKRSEYITAELLPDWVFKTMNLEKLEADRIDIEAKYNKCITSLVTEYWEGILQEIL